MLLSICLFERNAFSSSIHRSLYKYRLVSFSSSCFIYFSNWKKKYFKNAIGQRLYFQTISLLLRGAIVLSYNTELMIQQMLSPRSTETRAFIYVIVSPSPINFCHSVDRIYHNAPSSKDEIFCDCKMSLACCVIIAVNFFHKGFH